MSDRSAGGADEPVGAGAPDPVGDAVHADDAPDPADVGDGVHCTDRLVADGGSSPDQRTDEGAGGARMDDADVGAADRAIQGETPLEAAVEESGAVDPVRAWFGELTTVEKYVAYAVVGYLGVVGALVAAGLLNASFLWSVVSLSGIFVLLSLGLNVQWGYSGLINFSVAAFFGVGAYTAALLASTDSPLTAGAVPVVNLPIVGVVAAMIAAAILAVLIGIPTLSLREDYLAIASLGLAEVVRIFIKNQPELTGGSRGVLGMPTFFEMWPVVGGVFELVPDPLLNAMVTVGFVLAAYLFLRRVHRSPWGRVQRLLRTDEDLAEALGKDTYRLRMQSFVIGSVIMALAGVAFVHTRNSVFPANLQPIRTFYVWIAVILGGTGNDRGAIIGGVGVVTLVVGTRFVPEVGVGAGALRLLLVGLLIVLIMRFRPEGVLPPQRELIWPAAEEVDDR